MYKLFCKAMLLALFLTACRLSTEPYKTLGRSTQIGELLVVLDEKLQQKQDLMGLLQQKIGMPITTRNLLDTLVRFHQVERKDFKYFLTTFNNILHIIPADMPEVDTQKHLADSTYKQLLQAKYLVSPFDYSRGQKKYYLFYADSTQFQQTIEQYKTAILREMLLTDLARKEEFTSFHQSLQTYLAQKYGMAVSIPIGFDIAKKTDKQIVIKENHSKIAFSIHLKKGNKQANKTNLPVIYLGENKFITIQSQANQWLMSSNQWVGGYQIEVTFNKSTTQTAEMKNALWQAFVILNSFAEKNN